MAYPEIPCGLALRKIWRTAQEGGTYPHGSLVIVDIRFVGHSQSGMIAARAERTGAEYLAVRSGKGSLARTVAVSLRGPR